VIANTDTSDPEPERLYEQLRSEFSEELEKLQGATNAQLRLQSAYTRATQIAGKPLTDGYHFGQTIINDYGRPEERGFNNVSGLSGWAAYGPFAVYADGEYQHSPSAPALPFSAREQMTIEDFSRGSVPRSLWPLPPDSPIASVNQTRLLDAYVALNFSNWQLSYGNQSLWWGPSQGGALMYSDNARPLRMFRINRVAPFTLPSVLSVFGPIRIEAFFGQYSGYEFVFAPSSAGGTLVGSYGQSLSNQPIVHGERVSFKPTANLEIGISRTTDYGGPGYPVTLHTTLRSLFSTGNTLAGNPLKPGSRRSGIDFSYHIRDAVTFYAEGLAEHDEITPLLGPDVAAWLAGVYIPRLPLLHKLDLRVEGGFTDPANSGNDTGFGAFYWDATWISGFQNDRKLMGSWIGRQGQGAQAWTTYWFGPRSKLQFGFRHQKVSRQFIADGGGTLTDANVRGEFWLGPNLAVSPFIQYERWLFPVIELRLEPRAWFLHAHSSGNQP
jgi:hypothetical protein